MINFNFNPNQKDFLKCEEQVIAFFGGIGNGKTFAGMYQPAATTCAVMN